MSESDAQAAVRIASEILDGSTPVLLGCRRICGPVHRLGIDHEKPFVTFIGVESETDHLPVDPEERKLWNVQVLIEKDKEIASATEWAKEMIFAASRAVVQRFGGAG
jgi:hypothetical protein